MRVLLDESLPRQLGREIAGHDVRAVQEERWTGLENGELLRLAVSKGFQAFLTADQNLQYQQNLANLDIAVIVRDLSGLRELPDPLLVEPVVQPVVLPATEPVVELDRADVPVENRPMEAPRVPGERLLRERGE